MSVFAPNLPWLQPGRPHAGKQPRTFSTVGFSRLSQGLCALWRRLSAARQAHTSMRRLQVIEKVHLGDKQFVALLELDGRTILASCAPGAPLQFATAQTLCPAPEPSRTHEGEAAMPPSKRAGNARATKFSGPAAAELAAGLAVDSPVDAIPAVSAPDLPPSSPAPSPLRARARARRRAATRPRGPAAAVLANDTDGAPQAQTSPSPEVAGAVPPSASFAAEAAEAPGSAPTKRPGRVSLAALVQPASAQTAAPLKSGKVKDAAPVSLAQTIEEPAKRDTQPPAKAAPPSTFVPETESRDDATFAALLQIRMLATEVFQELDTPPPPPMPPFPPPAKPSGLARRLSISACFLVCCLLPHASAHAAVAHLPAVLAAVQPAGNDIHITGLGGSSAPWAIVVVLTLLTLIPSLMFCITPFARILIVFHFLRQALGLQTTPSNQTLIGLSLILTFFIMQPTGEVIYRDAVLPVQAGKLTPLDGVLRAGEPMRHFMAHYVRAKDAELFLDITHEPRPRTVEDMSFRVLLPAYILSELKAGFQIGTVLFLPFLIVDMVIASITTSVGMMQLPPVVISTPLKLLLFLMVDGWHLLIGSLMRSFN